MLIILNYLLIQNQKSGLETHITYESWVRNGEYELINLSLSMIVPRNTKL